MREDRGLVGEGNAGVDVEHLRARLHLGERVRDDGVEVPCGHLGRQCLRPVGIDALADHHERALEPDHHLSRRRAQNRLAHPVSPPLARTSRSRIVVGVRDFQPLRLLHDLGVDVLAAGARLAAPLLEVGVRADQPGSHRGRVDRFLEALGQLDGRAPPSRLGRHLRRDVPPPDHGQVRQRRHHRAKRVSDGSELAVPVRRCSKASPRKAAAATARSCSAGSSVWAR